MTPITFPKLSIVLPTYNRPTLLYSWLNNVLHNQTAKPDQIIIVNDSPNDTALFDLIHQFDTDIKITYIHNQVNRGVTASNYIGLQEVTSEFVMFCADDDELRTNAIEKIKQAIDAFPSVGFVTGRSMWHDRVKGVTWVSGRSMEPGYYYDANEVTDLATKGHLRIPGEATVYRTNIIRNAGLYRPELKLFADLYMTWSLTFHVPFVVLDHVITDFYLNPAGHYAKLKDKVEMINDEARRMIIMFERGPLSAYLDKIRNSGIIGFTDVDPEFIKKHYPMWDTVAFRGHCLLRKFERFTRRWAPAWMINLFGKFYR